MTLLSYNNLQTVVLVYKDLPGAAASPRRGRKMVENGEMH